MFSANKGIILAADVGSLEELRKLALLASGFPEVVGLKLGFSLALRFGLPTVVRVAKESAGISLIYDHQKAATDIPAMGEPFAALCKEAGLYAVIFFPHSGPRTLEAFIAGAIKHELVPIVGAVMTHPAFLQSEGGYMADDSGARIFRTAIEAGVSAFVLPGTKLELIRELAEGPLAPVCPATVMMPGIGTQGGSLAAAFNAVFKHKPYAIVGSAIFKAPDPRAALEGFVREMNS